MKSRNSRRPETDEVTDIERAISLTEVQEFASLVVTAADLEA